MQQSKRSKLRHARSRTWSVTNNTTHPSCQVNHLRMFENNPSYTHHTHTHRLSLALLVALWCALSQCLSTRTLRYSMSMSQSLALWLSGSPPHCATPLSTLLTCPQCGRRGCIPQRPQAVESGTPSTESPNLAKRVTADSWLKLYQNRLALVRGTVRAHQLLHTPEYIVLGLNLRDSLDRWCEVMRKNERTEPTAMTTGKHLREDADFLSLDVTLLAMLTYAD